MAPTLANMENPPAYASWLLNSSEKDTVHFMRKYIILMNCIKYYLLLTLALFFLSMTLAGFVDIVPGLLLSKACILLLTYSHYVPIRGVLLNHRGSILAHGIALTVILFFLFIGSSMGLATRRPEAGRVFALFIISLLVALQLLEGVFSFKVYVALTSVNNPYRITD